MSASLHYIGKSTYFETTSLTDDTNLVSQV